MISIIIAIDISILPVRRIKAVQFLSFSFFFLNFVV